MTELSNLCGLAQVRAVKKSCHAALVFSHTRVRAESTNVVAWSALRVKGSPGRHHVKIGERRMTGNEPSAPPVVAARSARHRDQEEESACRDSDL